MLREAETFLYAGYCATPEGLSLAQRAAWGIRLPQGAGFGQAATIVRRPADRDGDPVGSFRATFERLIRCEARAHKPQNLARRTNASCVIYAAKRRIAMHSDTLKAVGRRSKPPIQYWRFRARAEGRPLTCTVVRGRIYIACGQPSSEIKG